MPRAALVEDTTNTVINVAVVTNSPPTVPGSQWILEANWAEGQQPSRGDIWDGTLPASFTPAPPVEETDLANMTPAELLDAANAKALELGAINAELQRQLGG